MQLKFLAEGRNRHVCLSKSGKYVVKFAVNEAGSLDNYAEHVRYKRFASMGYANYYARCRLMQNGALVMEKLREPTQVEWDNLPDWTLSIDCRQVGYDHKGNLKAYDYGN